MKCALLFCMVVITGGACSSYLPGVMLKSPKNVGYIMGNIHINPALLKGNESEVLLFIKDKKQKKSRTVFCKIARVTNYICYYLVPLKPGAYELENVSFNASDFVQNPISFIKLRIPINVKAGTVSYLYGYSLGEHARKKSVYRFVKHDNIINTIDYFKHTYHVDILKSYPVVYPKDLVTVRLMEAGHSPFNLSGQILINGVDIKRLFWVIKNTKNGHVQKYMLRSTKGPFYLMLAPGKYQVLYVYAPDKELMWKYPANYLFQIEGNQQARFLGKHVFSYNETDAVMAFRVDRSEVIVHKVIRNKNIRGNLLLTEYKNFSVPSAIGALESVCGFFNVNRPDLKKLVLSVKDQQTDKAYHFFVDYFLQPFCFRLPAGRYSLDKLRVLNRKNEWNLASPQAKDKSIFQVYKDGTTFIGDLRFSVISDFVLSYDLKREEKDIARFKSLATKQLRLY